MSTLTLARCTFVSGACRATWRHAFRPSAARGGHVLWLRSDSVRGGATWLRRVRIRSEPCGLHAHLGGFNIVGGIGGQAQGACARATANSCESVQTEIDQLGVETDGKGWRAKVFLYCVEARCPQTGWMVPLLPTLIMSKGYRVVAELVPDAMNKRYDIAIRCGVSEDELEAAETGPLAERAITVKRTWCTRSTGRVQDEDFDASWRLSRSRTERREPSRLWDKHDFMPRPDDIFQERLYCVQWMRPKKSGKGDEYEFRSVTAEDLERERTVEDYVAEHLADGRPRAGCPICGSRSAGRRGIRAWT